MRFFSVQSAVGIAVAIACMLSLGTARASTSSKLQIQIPPSLKKEGGYEHMEALFGDPPYGKSIEATVYYADETMCDLKIDYSRGGYPQRPQADDGQMIRMQAPFIMMVDRGDCSFVKKVRNAQRAGASAVLIADDKCLCAAAGKCIMDDPDDKCETSEPIMADDGSGADIQIPAFLVFKQEADPIKKVLLDNQSVRAKMAWSLPQEGDTVEYEIWSTPTDDTSRPLMRDFRHVVKALKGHATFTPHMYMFDGIKAGCQTYEQTNQCSTLCTNSGRYCLMDPDSINGGVTGVDVVEESVRRLCIWDEYGKDGMGLEWWLYVEEFLYRCNDKHFTNEECIKDAMSAAGVSPSRIQACMEDSGGFEGNVENKIVESELAQKEATGVIVLPSFYVNKTPLRGAFTTAETFEAICAAFPDSSQPAVCKTCRYCRDVLECIKTEECAESLVEEPSNSVSTPVFVTSLVGLTVCLACIGIIQWQRSQRQMRAQIRGIMAEYQQVDATMKVETVGFDEDE